MEITSHRPDIMVAPSDQGTTLTLFARNGLVTWIVSIAGGMACLWLLAIAAYALASANYVNALLALSLTGVALWLSWYLGWRPRPFAITFSADSLQAGPHRYAYGEIRDYGLSRQGGDVVDTVSTGVPRNVTIGLHLYIDTADRRLPITVGLNAPQAKEARRLFDALFRKYSADNGAPGTDNGA